MQFNRALFLDLDGTIIITKSGKNFPTDIDDWMFIPKVLDNIKFYSDQGYIICIVTNQGGIELGYITHENIDNKLKDITKEIEHRIGTYVNTVYCPYMSGYHRKPNPGMILKARDKYNINLRESFMVGDTLNDIETGLRAECQTVLVLTGYGKEERDKIDEILPDFIFDNLIEFAKNLKMDSKL